MNLSELMDREEIKTSVAEVAQFVDHKQWRELQGLYADEVETDYTALFGGEIQQQSAAVLIEGWRKLLTPAVTQHLLGPITVASTGTSAIARCHFRAYHRLQQADDGAQWLVAGQYDFRFSKITERWRIQAMKLHLFYQSGSVQLLLDASGG